MSLALDLPKLIVLLPPACVCLRKNSKKPIKINVGTHEISNPPITFMAESPVEKENLTFLSCKFFIRSLYMTPLELKLEPSLNLPSMLWFFMTIFSTSLSSSLVKNSEKGIIVLLLPTFPLN